MKACLYTLTVLLGVVAGNTSPAQETPKDITFWLREKAAVGGHIVVPPGEYVLSGPVEIKSNTRLQGPATLRIEFEGATPSEKNAFGAANAALVANGSNIVFQDLNLKKKFLDGSYGVGILSTGGSKDITIRGVEISGYSARYGIHLVETTGFEISGCHIHSFMVDTTADMILDSPAGLRVTRSSQGVIAHNRIINIEVGHKGLQSISPIRTSYGEQTYQSDHMTLMECKDVAIVGNTMSMSGEGIDILLCSRLTVTGNSISEIWNEGIKALGVSQSTLSNNIIRDATVGIGLRRHSGQNYECWDNAIVGNTIVYTKPVFGLSVPGRSKRDVGHLVGIDIEKADHLTVVGNTISDVQMEPMMSAGIRGECPECMIESNNIRGAKSEAMR